MWIANDWKEYEVIGAPGPAGYLGYSEGKPWLEKHERPLSQKQKRRRRMGIL